MGFFRRKQANDPPAQPAVRADLPTADTALSASLSAHSQFVKRSTCRACGGIKALPSETAYVYCDYCGSLTDYDFRVANAGTNAGITNTVYQRVITPYQGPINQAMQAGDRDAYRGIMLEVFRQWLDACPEAMSPRGRTDLAFRERMITYCAEAAVTKNMDPHQRHLEAQFNALVAATPRIPVPGGAWTIQPGAIWPIAQLWKQQIDLVYEAMRATGVTSLDPDDPPAGIAEKMEHSTFCQGWLPHLSAEEGAQLLAMFDLTGDYQPVTAQDSIHQRCGGCGHELEVMTGARTIVCGACGIRLDVGAGAVPCQQCAQPLSYPEGVSELNCPACGGRTARV